jgi:hypothetical protein
MREDDPNNQTNVQFIIMLAWSIITSLCELTCKGFTPSFTRCKYKFMWVCINKDSKVLHTYSKQSFSPLIMFSWPNTRQNEERHKEYNSAESLYRKHSGAKYADSPKNGWMPQGGAAVLSE